MGIGDAAKSLSGSDGSRHDNARLWVFADVSTVRGGVRNMDLPFITLEDTEVIDTERLIPRVQPIHRPCGFRDRVGICKFHAEDCKPEMCDFYNIPFNSRDILKRMKAEHEDIKRLQETRENQDLLKDKVNDYAYLSQAWTYLKRCGK